MGWVLSWSAGVEGMGLCSSAYIMSNNLGTAPDPGIVFTKPNIRATDHHIQRCSFVIEWGNYCT